jgi:hypothetical protein
VTRFSICIGVCLVTGSARAQGPAATAAFPADPPPAAAPESPPPAAPAETPPPAPPPPEAAAPTTAPAAAPAATTGGQPETPPGDDTPGNRPGEPRLADANVDRVIVFSTAETHPKGTFFFSDYEILLLQFGYAFTDNVQLALSGVPPIVENQPYFFDLALKANLHRSDIVRAGLVLAGTAILLPDVEPSELYGARFNGIGQFCFERLCRSSFSFNAGTFLNSESNTIVPITLAGGTVIGASKLVKFLVEPVYSLAVGEGVEDQPEGFLLNYGIRLSGTNFGFDLAFLLPIGNWASDSPLILGVPWLALTYRTDGDPR